MSAKALENADVRMRGFTRRARVADVLAWIDGEVRPLAGERIALAGAAGRVLAGAVIAGVDVPAFDRSAMDGYALSGHETTGAGPYNPLSLRVVGTALPGQPWAGQLGGGQAVRVMTGAPMPQGADAVLPVEYAREHAGVLEVLAAVPPGKHVGRRGEDITGGRPVLNAGRRLRPQDLGVIASVGIGTVPVARRPQVRLLITGNELVPPGEPKGPHAIYDANSSMLQALVQRDGGSIESLRPLRDEREALRAALQAPGADVILISGGTSVGSEDHAPVLLAECGELLFHGVAMRPSSPAGLGRIDGRLVFLLPGNPVSCLCAYDFFVARALRRLAGDADSAWPYPVVELPLARKISSAVGRTDYFRVRREGGCAQPLAVSGAAILSSTSRADGFVVVPEHSEGFAEGTVVPVYLYDHHS